VENMTGLCDWFDPPECDCPVRHLHVDGVCLEVHYEPDGSVHALCDAGDWQDETTLVGVADLDDASARTLLWFNDRHPPESDTAACLKARAQKESGK
jgi:hypothetical protein